MIRKAIGFLSICLCLVLQVQAQNYPVDVFIGAGPNAAPYLDGHTNSLLENLNIQLLLKDNNEISYPVRLQITITSTDNTFSIETNNAFVPSAIPLDFGVPYQISTTELQDYFNPQNITVNGPFTQAQWEANGRILPSGSYIVCVTVYDFFRFDEAPLSNPITGCIPVFAEEQPPPEIVQPFPDIGSEVAIIPNYPSLFTVTWLHSPVGCPGTQYTLRLYEKVQGLTPQMQIDAGIGLMLPVLENLPLLPIEIDPASWSFDPTKEYFMQVQAEDPVGGCVFLFNGYSNIVPFIFDSGVSDPMCDNLPEPALLDPSPKTTNFKIRWEPITHPDLMGYWVVPATGPAFVFDDSLSALPPIIQDKIAYATAAATEHSVEDVDSMTTYYYKVYGEYGGAFSGCLIDSDLGVVTTEGDTSTVKSLPPDTPCEEITAAESLPATDIDGSKFRANWTAAEFDAIYVLEVSTDPEFTNDAEVYRDSTTGLTQMVTGLEFNTTYYYRVHSILSNETDTCVLDPENIIEVTTQADDGCKFSALESYECGDDLSSITFDGEPVSHLNVGDTVVAGDFLVILTEVSGSNPFSGAGYVDLPFANIDGGDILTEEQSLRINLTFTDISVNEFCQMTDGFMGVGGFGLNVLSDDVTSVLDDIVDQLETIEDILDAIEDILTTLDDLITEIEPYLPDTIVQNLVDAQQGLEDAQSFYDSIVAHCDTVTSVQDSLDCFAPGGLIDQAEDSLQNAVNTLEDAIDDYQDAMVDFIADFVDLFIQVIQAIIDDCNGDEVEEEYIAELDSLYTHLEDLNGFSIEDFAPPDEDPNLTNQLLYKLTEAEVLEAPFDQGEPTTCEIVDSFYSAQESAFECELFLELLAALGADALSNPSFLEDLKALFEEAGVNLFHLIGSRVKAINEGEMTEEQAVAELVIEVQQIIESIIGNLNNGPSDFDDLIENLFGGL